MNAVPLYYIYTYFNMWKLEHTRCVERCTKRIGGHGKTRDEAGRNQFERGNVKKDGIKKQYSAL